MKKKQFMSKLAALTMAAAMGITALPATTVFAANEKIVSDDQAMAKTLTDGTTGKAADAVAALNGKTVTKPATVSAAKSAIEALVNSGIDIDGDTTDEAGSFTIAKKADGTDDFTASTAATDGSLKGVVAFTGSKTHAANTDAEPEKTIVDSDAKVTVEVSATWKDGDSNITLVTGDTTDTAKVYANKAAQTNSTTAASDLALVKTNDLVDNKGDVTASAATTISKRLTDVTGTTYTVTDVAKNAENSKLLDITFSKPSAFKITTDLHDGKAAATHQSTEFATTDDEDATAADKTALNDAAGTYATTVASELTAPSASEIQDGISKYLGKGASAVVKGTPTVADNATDASKQTVTATVNYNGHDYTVKFDITKGELTNAQKMAKIKKTVQDALDAHEFSASSDDDTLSEVKTVVDTALATLPDEVKQTHKGHKLEVTYGDLTDSEDSDENTRGKVSGSVTLKFAADAADDKTSGEKTWNKGYVASGKETSYAAVAEISETVNFTANRKYAAEKLTDEMATIVKNWIQTQDFQNGVTGETIAKRINALLTSEGKITNILDTVSKPTLVNKKYADTFNGVTATVTNPRRVDTQAHNKAKGKYTADVTLTAGSTTKTFTITDGPLVHSDSEKLDELDAAITKAATDYKTTGIQKKNAAKAADPDAVKAGVVKIINNAIASKVNNGALSIDGWDALTEGKFVNTSDSQTSTAAIKGVIDGAKSFDAADDVKGPQATKYDIVYTPSTVKENGAVVVTVSSQIPDSEAAAVEKLAGTYKAADAKDLTKVTTFTLSLEKLKATKDTYLRFTQNTFTAKYDSKLNDKAVEDGKSENEDNDNTYDLSVSTLLQRDGNDEVKWTSSDDSVAVVDKNGLVTLKGVGEATITVADVDNPSLSTSITVISNGKYIFKDVQNVKDYYYKPVKWAATNGITSGISKDEFGTTTPVTRAQFVTWLYNVAGKPVVASGTEFTDVDAKAYYADAVAWGAQNGIVAGYSDGTFKPNEVVTREQAVAFLNRRYGDGAKYIAKVPFTDVSESSYAYNAIQWAYENEITAGKTATTFAPKDTLTRAEGISLLYRTVKSSVVQGQ